MRAIKASIRSWGWAALLSPTTCGAHSMQSAAGFVSGLLHPVFGVDHFLAMLSVGIISAQLGGKNIFRVPALFVIMMIIGASIGLLGFSIANLEAGIALSVILLSMAIVLIKGSSYLLPIMACVGFFGFLHGYSHGLEMPKASDPVFYAGGFVISTVAIHLTGVAIGHYLTAYQRFNGVLRHMGSLMTGMGIMIFFKLF